MARLVPVCLILLAAGAGCKHRLAFVRCDDPCPPGGTACPPPAADCPTPGGPGATPTATAGPPRVEVKAPEVIHVKAPAQKITVTLPPDYGVGCADGSCGPPAQFHPHQFGQQPMMSPQPQLAPQPMMAMAPQPVAYAPAAPLLTSTQTVRPRTRIGLGFDICRIPIPVPRLMAFQGEQEVVTRQTYAAPPQQAFAPAPAMAYAPQPMMAYAPQPMMAAPQPVAYAPTPAYAPMPVAAGPAPVAYAPAPAAPVLYAPPPAPPIQGVICVPTDECDPTWQPAGKPAGPACPPDKPQHPLLNRLHHR